MHLLYDVTNPTKAPQIFFDGITKTPNRVEPGETLQGIEIVPQIAVQLRNQGPLHFRDSIVVPPRSMPVEAGGKPPLIVIGMNGIGDCIHQRAVLRELMRTRDVWLETCHAEMYHDLIALGLKLIFRPTSLHAQARTVERERGAFSRFPLAPNGAQKIKLWYHKAEIDKCGSIAEAMFDPFGLRNNKPDFSLPVRAEWIASARKLIEQWKPDRPLMAFRPIVKRREWDGEARNPDPAAYKAIFEAIRERYFVVSVADLVPGVEWIVGDDLPADVKLHHAELDFPTLVGLWREADLVFGNAGFGPVLAQAVGTPTLVVYGGRESYRTTERAGAHLAPTLGIDPISPCDCHSHHHKCDKRMDIPAAIERAQAFVTEQLADEARAVRAQRQDVYTPPPPPPPVMLNFGCGTNHLAGWRNMDIEVNIEEPLPFASGSADAVFSEHCVEHTSQYKAVAFFKEAFRVLRPGGLIRITVPCLPQIIDHSAADYWQFASKWTRLGPTLEGAMDAIVHAHGHQTIWGPDTLRAALFLAGFRELRQQKPGLSDYEALRGIEGHGHVIGDKFNELESLTFEGRKPNVDHVFRGSGADAGARAAASLPAPTVALTNPRTDAENRGQADSRRVPASRTLIFATTYVDCPERQELTQQWLELHTSLNPNCDFLLVDSASPVRLIPHPAEFSDFSKQVEVFNFGDNIGHLSRGGRDGWGRAFCKGLDLAVERGYDSVLHIEGDSLCRVSAHDMVEMMRSARKGCATIPVIGTTRPVSGWVETGLMVFNVEFLKASGFTKRYDWPNRLEKPTPELIIARILQEQAHMMPLVGRRNDDDKITYKNVVDMNLDWITHCHRDVWAYGEFMKAALEAQQKPLGGDPALEAAKGAVKVAVVVGGSLSVHDELKATAELIGEAEARYFVINSMLPLFEGPCTGISLHPPKLAAWLEERARNGHPAPGEVWAHIRHKAYPSVTHVLEDLRGSSGLFAIAVARRLGYEKIILCGVPMTIDGGHVERGREPWKARDQFLGGWQRNRAEFAPFVRSWSGWTAETFGRPTREFLEGT